jgi:tetratricopeptide (TPR) repeat protein
MSRAHDDTALGGGESAEAWRAARDLFLEFAELEEGARRAALAELAARDAALAARVERLLASDPGEQRSAPQRFGPYETVRRIASGGMGDVFLARRVDGEFEREVAIKLLRTGVGGDAFVERFLQERRTLAQLDHEYIARLIDGGTTAVQRPYLVLEYVDGQPLDEHCRVHALDLVERLRLFRRVLAAVEHAHARGVVHRDLKPSNVLVRKDGAPRLVDFGIAHVLEQDAELARELTRTGQRLFTPRYASPEQVLGREATPATDVFALGVVLYELVCEASPWPEGLGEHELERAVLEHEPAPPSRVRSSGRVKRGLASDVDTLVAKCLAKAPRERYGDARELAADIERLLDGRPLAAKREGVFARTWRRVRRRPARAVAVLVLLVVVAGAVAANEASVRAERARARVAARVDGLVDEARVEREAGRIDAGVERLENALAELAAYPGESLRRAHVLTQFAVTLNHRNDFVLALARLDEAEVALNSARVADGDEARAARVRVSLLNARSFALGEEKRAGEAREVNERALELARQHLPPGDELRVDAWLELAARRRADGDEAGVLAALDEGRAEVLARGDPNDEALGAVQNERGATLGRAQRHGEALVAYEDALRIFAWNMGDGHPALATVRANVGETLFELGRYDEAAACFEQALEVRLVSEQPGPISVTYEQLGKARLFAGDFDEAQAAFDEAHERLVAYVGRQHEVVRRVEHWRVRLGAARGEDVSGALERVLSPHLWAGPLDPKYEAILRGLR